MCDIDHETQQINIHINIWRAHTCSCHLIINKKLNITLWDRTEYLKHMHTQKHKKYVHLPLKTACVSNIVYLSVLRLTHITNTRRFLIFPVRSMQGQKGHTQYAVLKRTCLIFLSAIYQLFIKSFNIK